MTREESIQGTIDADIGGAGGDADVGDAGGSEGGAGGDTDIGGGSEGIELEDISSFGVSRGSERVLSGILMLVEALAGALVGVQD
ncbi:hypothetical protein GH714_018821 [Hevea brasiliensis]|uniref:Uncharacterized protein n=1 Tax=Hevea brasiliensis TaxID=3981 RepID=A0A6A6KUI6_HEVBR|nr:hypothetical protein GH714_018821 [Hevea brasiliensis]